MESNCVCRRCNEPIADGQLILAPDYDYRSGEHAVADCRPVFNAFLADWRARIRLTHRAVTE